MPNTPPSEPESGEERFMLALEAVKPNRFLPEGVELKYQAAGANQGYQLVVPTPPDNEPWFFFAPEGATVGQMTAALHDRLTYVYALRKRDFPQRTEWKQDGDTIKQLLARCDDKKSERVRVLAMLVVLRGKYCELFEKPPAEK
ncbi:hypothetical protein COU80_03885 [Candidatus Peregrinibacteria bacterium CG10_big_fil_rev_8_21_14_0_10_55_24]|nr:MAG: hypothetical protein COU80_03885 [Candidatus Peregrinibacteria bacterium CG10_big_fil_rev_8_21_14_0_10_55_24]